MTHSDWAIKSDLDTLGHIALGQGLANTLQFGAWKVGIGVIKAPNLQLDRQKWHQLATVRERRPVNNLQQRYTL